MIVRRFLTPPLVIGVLLVAAVAVAGGFITSPLPIDTTVWNDFIASRTPAMNTFMTGASWLFDPKRERSRICPVSPVATSRHEATKVTVPSSSEGPPASAPRTCRPVHCVPSTQYGGAGRVRGCHVRNR